MNAGRDRVDYERLLNFHPGLLATARFNIIRRGGWGDASHFSNIELLEYRENDVSTYEINVYSGKYNDFLYIFFFTYYKIED